MLHSSSGSDFPRTWHCFEGFVICQCCVHTREPAKALFEIGSQVPSCQLSGHRALHTTRYQIPPLHYI